MASRAAAMVSSMTAFGRGFFLTPQGGLQIVISSVNRRHLEVTCQVPDALAHLQPEIRRAIQKVAQRGMVTVTVILDRSNRTEQEEVLSRARLWEQVAVQLGPQWDRTLTMHLLAEDPFLGATGSRLEMDNFFDKTLQEALEVWQRARRQEGEVLVQDLLERLKLCRSLVEQLSQWAEQIRPQMHERLQSSLGEWHALSVEEQGRFAREWVQLIDRADAVEEIVRLRAHLDKAEQMLMAAGPVGKTLEFLWQEMLREANTCAGKIGQVRWGSADPIHATVELKTELERMREQSQNLE